MQKLNELKKLQAEYLQKLAEIKSYSNDLKAQAEKQNDDIYDLHAKFREDFAAKKDTADFKEALEKSHFNLAVTKDNKNTIDLVYSQLKYFTIKISQDLFYINLSNQNTKALAKPMHFKAFKDCANAAANEAGFAGAYVDTGFTYSASISLYTNYYSDCLLKDLITRDEYLSLKIFNDDNNKYLDTENLSSLVANIDVSKYPKPADIINQIAEVAEARAALERKRAELAEYQKNLLSKFEGLYRYSKYIETGKTEF